MRYQTWLVVFLACFINSCTPAFAHKAPAGWTYDMECCSDQDCMEVPASFVRMSPGGYEIPSRGVTIPYGDKRIRIAPDGKWHVCEVQDDLDAGNHILCIYVPGTGS